MILPTDIPTRAQLERLLACAADPRRRRASPPPSPESSPPGANGLFWGLDPFGARAPKLHARVTIDK